jgi:hypothetical protein
MGWRLYAMAGVQLVDALHVFLSDPALFEMALMRMN